MDEWSAASLAVGDPSVSNAAMVTSATFSPLIIGCRVARELFRVLHQDRSHRQWPGLPL